MARQYRNNGSAGGRRPTALLKFAAALLAVTCIAGPAMGLPWNVGTKRIVSPPAGNTDSGTVVVPSAVITNPGDSTATFPVLFTIGAFYTSTKTVTALAHGDSVTVTFDTWIAIQRGAQTAKCSTQLAADESTANDKVTRNFTVRVQDVGVDSIYAPLGIVDSGTTVTPQAHVTNHGTGTATFMARFRIGTSYRDSQNVMNLTSGSSRTLNFTNWPANTSGTYAALCTLALTGDSVPGNNWKQDSFTVMAIHRDVSVERMIEPNGVVDSGRVFTPQAIVRNYGNIASSFPVIFKIGSGYADTMQVSSLPPQDSQLVTFAYWTASPTGTFATRCSTALAGDTSASNDKVSDSVKVIVRTTDAGVLHIIAPADTVDSGSVYAPKAVVRNFGLTALSFPVRMTIGAYADTQHVTSLASHESLTVTFKNWTVPQRGLATAACSTLATGDQDPTNDLASMSLFRRVRDVGVESIGAPIGTMKQDTVVTPSAALLNLGTTTDSFPVIFRIGAFYADTQRTNGTSVTFRACTLKVVGKFSVTCSTAMTGDLAPSNNAVTETLQVKSASISGSSLAGIPRTVVMNSQSPFANHRSPIVYGLPRSTQVRLEVFDACGRPVQTLATGMSEPGYHTVVWHCTDGQGRAVPEGAYFVRLTADGTTLTSKLVKLE
ncbi:MAG TPA: CARDB domain-containing protein [bacterium]|nr:CARDB domain-containing protein [bacterium]